MKRNSAYRGSSGFTLIELLVVIVIIAMLAGLLLAGISAVQDGARRNKARVFEQALLNAIKAYRNDNDAWPGQTQGANDHFYVTGGDGNANNILGTPGSGSGSGLTNNPRNINYLEIPPGMFNGTDFIDSWNRPFVVAMDENMDGVITFNSTYGGITFANVVVTDGVAIVSGGRAPATPSTWVCSWK